MKNILATIGGFFKSIYTKVLGNGDATLVKLPQLPENVQITPEMVDHCISTVNIIKNIIDNPVLILATDLTPIQMDNTVRIKVSDALPGILAGLTYAKDVLASSADAHDAINTILAKVRLSADPDKDALYHSLCARIIMVASDGKVTWSEAVSILELYLKQVFVPASTPAQVAVAV